VRLSEVVKDLPCVLLQGSDTLEINGIEYDSRKVKQGDVFVCITGFQTDGHTFAQKAVDAGAAALICEHRPEGDFEEGVAIIQVPDTRVALAKMSVAYYKSPSADMNVIGITGTNGKTTTTYLIKSILDKKGRKVGVIGTIENLIGDEVLPTQRTTPESKELQELLHIMKRKNVTDVVMEVSSHALDLHRVDGVAFSVGVFTNLTQDHLDYHKTMEHYKEAKAKLFSQSKKSVINLDDPCGVYMKSAATGDVITFGIETDADLQAKDIKITAEGTHFLVIWKDREYTLSLHTPGRFSVYNALGAIGACLLLDIEMEEILVGLAENQGVSGRFQTIKSEKGLQAVVDYAHTPDGLDKVLKTTKEFAKGRVITVFGCGGNRDKTKRPIMGEIAGRESDYCIITSDNPRTEDPMQILDEVEAGIQKTACPYAKIADRREAIVFASKMAKERDVIVVAGKGHENYQVFADKTVHFDDVEEIRKAFGEV